MRRTEKAVLAFWGRAFFLTTGGGPGYAHCVLNNMSRFEHVKVLAVMLQCSSLNPDSPFLCLCLAVKFKSGSRPGRVV